jgi:hypothetical protein
MRTLALPAALSLAFLAAGCGGNDSNNNNNQKFTIAMIGDVPYGTTPTDTTESLLHPAFLTAINADADAQFVMHVGDIHSGKQFCTLAYDQQIAADWKAALKKPMIYTPGDNEWTDCHKSGEGGGTYSATTGQVTYVTDASGKLADYAGGDPIQNLDLVRSIFFTNPGRDFTNTMDLHSQAKEYDTSSPSDSSYPENVWFEKNGVLFVTINLPGGSNNDTDPWYGAPAMSPAQQVEVANRSAADLHWLTAAFNRATSDNVTAVLIGLQADMWDIGGNAPAHLTGYKQYVDSIATFAKSFGKPVLLINGDSHVYRSDNPLVQGSPCLIDPASGSDAVACKDDGYAGQPNGYNVTNFHRIVVHGSTTPLEWLKLTIDPGYDHNAAATATSFGPFSWQRVRP